MTARIGISTGGCYDRPIVEVVADVAKAGAAAIEVGTPPGHFNPLQDGEVEALDRALRAASLQPVSIHAPFGGLLDLADPNPRHRHAAVGAVLTAASAIKRLGGSMVIVHPSDLERHGRDVGVRLADCAESLRLLALNCAAEGVTVALESPLPHLIGGDPGEFAWLLEHSHETVRVCLDTGHTALGGHWNEFLRVSGSRLVHVHVHDNRGHWDDHLPPGEGVIDWAAIAGSLRTADFHGWLMLELSCPGNDRAAYFGRASLRTRELFTRDVAVPGRALDTDHAAGRTP
ncbi:MAG TPA: sugar phosphate isomerase/epimerase family protein [Vicinamibacterales bacterium]|nr:sugar phosphate isomerase/epimerase family protein [Vicinamibacterales bacterium]